MNIDNEVNAAFRGYAARANEIWGHVAGGTDNPIEAMCTLLMYSQADLARETGLTAKTISEVKKKGRLTKSQKELFKWTIWKRIAPMPELGW